MPEFLTARLRSWDAGRGFGFLRLGSQNIFLHQRDFAERHKEPAAGDVIRFTLGTDAQGRPCAREAAHFNDGGCFDLKRFLALLLLLITPALALTRLALPWSTVAIAAVSLSAMAYLIYALDKSRAKARDWRIPENVLHFIALAGGWPGAFVAQQRLRHKCSKLRFQIVFWLIVAAYELVALDFLLDWRMAHSASQTIRHWLQLL